MTFSVLSLVLVSGCLEEVTGVKKPLDDRYFRGQPEPPTTTGPPPEMIRIEREGREFWIDIYEYPNKAGEQPVSSTSFKQAKSLCLQEGKRLCTAHEWRTACRGKDNYLFGYGNTYEKKRCHLQVDLPSGHTSMMNPEDQIAKSGEYQHCRTPDGVHDLVGNLEEWVLDDWKGLPAGLEGGAWYTYHKYANCEGMYSRQPDYRISVDRRIFSAGVRCCWSKEDVTQQDIQRDASARLEKIRLSQGDPVYDSENEIALSKDTFIDTFEYPNRSGAFPQTAVSWEEARNTCLSHNKRLCEAYEWEIACGETLYPYGNSYIPLACAIQLDAVAPSGYYFGCQSLTGAKDMVGNVWEWTNTPLNAKALEQGLVLKEIRGGSWFVDKRKATCQGLEGYPATSAQQAFPDVGFRCCRGPKLKRKAKAKKPGKCPKGMISSGISCIDQYEYPNRENAIPLGGVNFNQAQELCQKQSKRLCSEDEWQEACMGWEGFRWPYGDQYVASKCVDAGSSTIEGESAVRPSGEAKDCMSTMGAFDMSGNLWEWTKDKRTGVLKGGGWNLSAGLGQCRSKARASQHFQAGEIGFRCCADHLD